MLKYFVKHFKASNVEVCYDKYSKIVYLLMLQNIFFNNYLNYHENQKFQYHKFY